MGPNMGARIPSCSCEPLSGSGPLTEDNEEDVKHDEAHVPTDEGEALEPVENQEYDCESRKKIKF